MRIIGSILLVVMMCGCDNKDTSLTVYSSINDSLFYYEGNKFDTTKLIKGIKTDTAFFDRFLKKLEGSKKIFYKPLNYSIYSGKMMLELSMLFFEKNITNKIERSILNNEETNYFNYVVSWKEDVDPIKLQSPKMKMLTGISNDPVLLIYLKKDNTVKYSYDSVREKAILRSADINADVIKILETIENTSNVELAKLNVVIKTDSNTPIKKLTTMMKALKQKNVGKVSLQLNEE